MKTVKTKTINNVSEIQREPGYSRFGSSCNILGVKKKQEKFSHTMKLHEKKASDGDSEQSGYSGRPLFQEGIAQSFTTH